MGIDSPASKMWSPALSPLCIGVKPDVGVSMALLSARDMVTMDSPIPLRDEMEPPVLPVPGVRRSVVAARSFSLMRSATVPVRRRLPLVVKDPSREGVD